MAGKYTTGEGEGVEGGVGGGEKSEKTRKRRGVCVGGGRILE